MIEVIDRIPTHPGRVTLTPVAGQENMFDMARADAPIVEGTPINKALFDGYYKTISDMIQAIDNKIFEATQLVPVGSLTDGTLFGLFENGIMVPYIKIASNYMRSGRALVVRRDCISQVEAYPGSKILYTNSDVDKWLNNEFFSTLDPATQGVMNDSVDIGVTVYNGTGSLYRKVFLLSVKEYGYSAPGSFSDLGDPVSYFSYNGRRIAQFNGTVCPHLTRSTDSSGLKVGVITVDGTYAVSEKTATVGIRPAFTLHADFDVTVGVPSTANVTATAEVV